MLPLTSQLGRDEVGDDDRDRGLARRCRCAVGVLRVWRLPVHAHGTRRHAYPAHGGRAAPATRISGGVVLRPATALKPGPAPLAANLDRGYVSSARNR